LVKETLLAGEECVKATHEASENLSEQTLFYEVPGNKIKHQITGVLLAILACAGEDAEMLKTSISFKSPFITLDLDSLKEDKEYFTDLYKAFTEYGKTL